LGFVPTLFADPAFTIAGVVHDGSGARISHAHVLARQTGSNVVLKAETGEQGEFTIEAPALGSYRVEVVLMDSNPLQLKHLSLQTSPLPSWI
jgi:hypothetical protein